jgi:hypothetical protein
MVAGSFVRQGSDENWEGKAGRLEAALVLVEVRLQHLLPDGGARECAQTLHTVAKHQAAQSSRGKLVAAAEKQLLRVGQECNPQDISNILWAYATLGTTPGEQLMALLEARVQVVVGECAGQHVAVTLWALATMGQTPGELVMKLLEKRVEEVVEDLKAQELANTFGAFAKMGRKPPERVLARLEARVERVVGAFKSQELSSLLWAFATLGRPPAERVRDGLEKKAEQLAGSGHFTSQEVATALWATCALDQHPFPAPKSAREEEEGPADMLARFATALAPRLHVLGDVDEIGLRQLQQVFLSCRLDRGLRARMPCAFLEDVEARLAPACREAFAKAPTVSSLPQLEVKATLEEELGLAVVAEARCPESGYSIDLLAQLVPPQQGFLESAHSDRASIWAIEFDGPKHFLACRTAKGGTLLKRRHLAQLGYNLVSVPHWEWSEACGTQEGRTIYLRDKLRLS